MQCGDEASSSRRQAAVNLHHSQTVGPRRYSVTGKILSPDAVGRRKPAGRGPSGLRRGVADAPDVGGQGRQSGAPAQIRAHMHTLGGPNTAAVTSMSNVKVNK